MKDLSIQDRFHLPSAFPEQKVEIEPAEGKVSFSDVLRNTIQDINKLQSDADEAISGVQVHDTGSIHEAMIALEKASISFQTMMQVRNKIIDAYQEVMRMQV
ncbi:flagellar hook-basal body complex protein FliE [Syntrophus aciditrophicus]|uniref:Flagellar hook-basal body complex protein FliE n=1 Tax=Syntrophus aciditrophicus (strain SB) TaxID=56780 RepID=Q2LRY7_SYNAS|nr:flagellar hook-basal body complex protein FliE [Syntrophus aciditrophicus]ABC76850.1 flagellar hook-basal body complex protein [Syntrophus aciditrophicus SB]